jgi:hypothetical protein
MAPVQSVHCTGTGTLVYTELAPVRQCTLTVHSVLVPVHNVVCIYQRFAVTIVKPYGSVCAGFTVWHNVVVKYSHLSRGFVFQIIFQKRM